MKQTKAVFVVHFKEIIFYKKEKERKREQRKNRETNRSRDIEKSHRFKDRYFKDSDIERQRHRKTET